MVANKRAFVLSFLLLGSIILAGCDQTKNYLKPDRSGNMEIQDYRDGLAERTPEVEPWDEVKNAASVPDFQPYISSVPEGLKPMPLVSISVNQTIPLRDIFYELAQQADYDIELDPRIVGSVIFSARNRPLDEVIDRIAEMSGLRYKIGDRRLRVELDTPYSKVYKVGYLNVERTNESTISTNVDVSGEGDGASSSSGSSFSASTNSSSEFWAELELNIQQILTGETTGLLKTTVDPQITATDQNPNVQPILPQTSNNGEVVVQPPEAVLRVDSLPVGTTAQAVEEIAASFTLNRQAGLLNVLATQRQHEEVDEYLKKLRHSVNAQVLVEAKILEVSLDDDFNAGIDWRYLGKFVDNGALSFGDNVANLDLMGNSLGETILGTGANQSFNLGLVKGDFEAFVSALSTFGAVRALASPRLTVLNNQSALLTVATNRVFFDLDVDVTTEDGTSQAEIDSEIRNVPEGVLINVMPSINMDNGTVTMSIRPTITSRVGVGVQDPAIAFAVATAGVAINPPNIPELNVQEIDSIIQMRSGQPIVMGGLLQDRATSTLNSVPVLGEIPMVGALFRDQTDTIDKSEIVILMRATILEQPEDTVHATDRDLYKMFAGDRRPFKL